MKIQIIPRRLQGVVKAPPSKSMAHRLLICGGLASGEKSIIRGVSDSEDVTATLRCLAAIGATYEKYGDVVEIVGTDIRNICPTEALLCNESGSTLRFFIPMCLLCNKTVSLTGTKKLLSRPLGVYETICDDQHIY